MDRIDIRAPAIMAALLIAVTAFLILITRTCVPRCGAEPEGAGRLDRSAAGVLPLDCTLFQAIYLPWTKVPTLVTPWRYQPSLADFLFRLNWNVTSTNCWEHRYDFDPPAEFDVVKRVMNFAGQMYLYFLHSSELKLTILAFTGTAFAADWALNLLFNQVYPATLRNVGLGIWAHTGFYTIYAQVQAEIQRLVECYGNCTRTFLITGYSLGGALATMCALDLAGFPGIPQATVYTFGAPRVFNPVGAKLLDRLNKNFWRIYNTEDIISDLPPAVAGESFIVNPWLRGDILYSHQGRSACWTDSRGSVLDNHSRAYELFLLAQNNPFSNT